MRPPVQAPRILRFLAGALLLFRDREVILGDLEEMYVRRAARSGRASAAWGYLRDTLASAPVRFLAGWRARTGAEAGGPGRAPHRRAVDPGGFRPGPRWGPVRLQGDLLADLRYAVRTLARERGFTTLTVLTLALGVGSTATVFGMVNQILLRPLPGVRDGEDAAYLFLRTADQREGTQSHRLTTLDFGELRREATLAQVASYGNVSLKASTGDERPISVRGNTIYGDYFEVLRAWPSAGRLLSAEETELGSDPLRAVISEHLAGILFGSPAAAVGKTVRLNDRAVTVVGVAGGGFRGAERGIDSDVWLPFGALVPLVNFKPETLVSRQAIMHGNLLVRPRAGATLAGVTTQLRQIIGRLAHADTENARELAKWSPRLYPGLATPPLVRAMTYRSLRILLGIVALVLLIACANVANLLLFRNVQQRGAVATHRALGASWARIARRQLVLSFVLGASGALAGLGVGWLIGFAFRGAHLVRMPAFDGLVLDRRVAIFAVAVSVGTALVFGTLPALLAGRFDLAGSLRQVGRGDTGRLARVRATLSAGQLGLGLTLLVGALLLVRTVHNLYAVDSGFDMDGVSTLFISYDRSTSPSEADVLYRNVLDAVRTVPGVEAAALDPYGPEGSSLVGRVALPGAPSGETLTATMTPVTPGWFELLRMPTVNGRTFTGADWRPGADPGVVLTASLARKLFGRTDVAGRTVLAGFGKPAPMPVVGVVGNVRSAYAPGQPENIFFVTYSTVPDLGLDFTNLIVRTQGSDPRTPALVRGAVEGVLPDEPIGDPAPLSARVDEIHAQARVFSQLLSLLSALAVLLSAVGLYGVVASTVAGRRREFGVRLALGAHGGRIAGLVARHATTIVLVGTALGLGGAYALSRVLRSRLFGVEPLDPFSYAAAALLFAVVASVACWVPARRAMRVDPVETLREE